MQIRMNRIKGILLGLAIAVLAVVACNNAYAQNPDSLKQAETALDSLDIAALDMLAQQKDSTSVKVYTKKELKRMHRDSVWAYKDSVLRNSPRILDTYVFEDTTKNKRMFLWNADTYFNKPEIPRYVAPTSFLW